VATSLEKPAVRAVVAGADCVVDAAVPDAAFEALATAVKSDEFRRNISTHRCDESSGKSPPWT